MSITIDVKKPETGDTTDDTMKISASIENLPPGTVEVRLQVRHSNGEAPMVSIPGIIVS